MFSWDEIWKIHKQEALQNNLLVRATFLFETGKILKAYDRLCDHYTDACAYLAEIRMELADTYTQIRMFCYVNNWSYERMRHTRGSPGVPIELIKELCELAADVQQKSLYTHLSGHQHHVDSIQSKVCRMITIIESLAVTFNFSMEEISDLGKSRIKNAKIQMAFEEENKCH